MPWEMAIPHPATRVHLLTLTALCPSLVSGERGTGAAQKGNSYTLNLAVQLEIMRQPLIEELEKQAQIPVWHALQKLPSLPRPKDQFDAKDLVLAAEAFLTHNAHVSAAEEAERFLDEDHRYLEDIGEIHEVVTVLQALATQIQPRLLQVYANDPTRRFILSGGGTFLISLAAACGYIRWRNNMKMLEGALDTVLGM